jgi:hypothetical protein
MFVPPENRQPRPAPWNPQPPKRELTKRERTVVIWVVGAVLVLMVLAPIGGSTVLEVLWYLLRR